MRKWKRVQPLDELLFDRWEKAKFVNAKSGTSIYHNSYLAGNVSIGKNTWIGPLTVLDGTGGKLRIGDFCSISIGAQISTHQTVRWALTGGKALRETASTVIENYCYVGPYVVVNMGVRIGKCSVIGALSFVNSDIPPYSIAFGIPAKVVGKVIVKGKKVKYIYFKNSKTIKLSQQLDY